jgi:hypothetical protein
MRAINDKSAAVEQEYSTRHPSSPKKLLDLCLEGAKVGSRMDFEDERSMEGAIKIRLWRGVRSQRLAQDRPYRIVIEPVKNEL